MTRSKISQARQTLQRILEYMLLRRPDEFGLAPKAGAYRLKDVLQALSEEGHPCRERDLLDLNHLAAAEGRPAPLKIEDGWIRLASGQLPAVVQIDQPPGLLYGWCRRRAHGAVAEHGLIPREDEFHLLSPTQEQALRLGRRKDPEPIVFPVEAKRAAQSGVSFWRLGEALYLCREMPARFLRLPPLPSQPPEKARPSPVKTTRPAMPAEDEMPGSFLLRPAREPEEKAFRDRERGRHKKEFQKERRRERQRKRGGL